MKVGASNELTNANKIIEYYKKFISKETTYYLTETNEKIDPEKQIMFIVGSRYSPEGHLFEKETKCIPHISPNLENHVKNKFYPREEYQRSSSYFRQNLIPSWKQIENRNPKHSMGVLYSTILNDPKTSRPLFFVYGYWGRNMHKFYD